MPKTKLKRGFYKYNTSAKMRKIGDALLACSVMGVPAILASYQWIGISLFLAGIIGKFLTNLFTEEVEETNTDETGN